MKRRVFQVAVLVGVLGTLTGVDALAGLPVSADDWIVGIYNGNKARHLDSAGSFVQDSPASYSGIIGIDTGPDGDVYAVDPGGNRIVRHSKADFASSTPVVTGLQAPQAIAFGPDGDLYIAETGVSPNRISRYHGPLDASPFTPVGGAPGTFATGLAGQIGFQDLDFGPDGNLYVSNWKTASTSPSPSIERFDGVYGAWIDTFVPASDPDLDNIRGMCFGPNGDIYAANYPGSGPPSGEVVRYQGPYNTSPGTSMGVFVADGLGGLDLPQVPRFGSDGNLYVTSYFSDTLLRYQGPNGGSPGASLGTFAGFSGGSGIIGLTQVEDEVTVPRAMGYGDWFVSMYYDTGVRQFDADGNFIQRISLSGGNGIGLGLSPGPEPDLFVADTDGNGKIRRFARTNLTVMTTVASFPAVDNPGGVDVKGDRIYAVTVSGISQVHSWLWDTPYTAYGQFTDTQSTMIGMQDIEFGPDGHLYVVNWKTTGGSPDPSIERFNGTTGVHMGTFVPDDANLDNVTGLAFGPDGDLYLGNKAADGEILRYEGPLSGSPGTFVEIFTPTGSGLGVTQDLDFGRDGNLYSCNWTDNTVTRYQGPDGSSPGAFIDTFIRLPTNSSGDGGIHGFIYMVQAPLEPSGTMVLVK